MFTKSTAKDAKKEPKFHILISYIYLQIFVAAVGILTCLAILSTPKVHVPIPMTHNMVYIAIGLYLVNIIGLRALLKWQKWGLWVFTLATLLAVPIGIHLSPNWKSVVAGCISFIILFMLYFVGGKKRAWDRLR